MHASRGIKVDHLQAASRRLHKSRQWFFAGILMASSTLTRSESGQYSRFSTRVPCYLVQPSTGTRALVPMGVSSRAIRESEPLQPRRRQ
jgi:hypothetical protein